MWGSSLLPPLSGRLWFPEAPFFLLWSALAADEHRAEPSLGSGSGLERTVEQRVEPLTRVDRLNLGPKSRGAGAAANCPRDVLTAGAQGTVLTVIRTEHVEMTAGQSDAGREVGLGQHRARGEPVDRLADEPEVAEHAARDHNAVNHHSLDTLSERLHVLD